MEQVMIVMTNLPDAASAQQLARHLVGKKLVACANCLPGVRSIYRWQGVVEEAEEVSVLLKITAARYGDVEAAIRSLHPYQVPEIIALPVTAGFAPYLQWVVDETKVDINA